MKGTKNIAASIRDRLRNRAVAENRPFDELLVYYAMERFLYRLSQTPHRERVVLKGALMLPIWGVTAQRPTRDIDLLARQTMTKDELTALVRDAIAVAVDDGLSFDAASLEISDIREQERYGGARAQFIALLERARVAMQIDVGLGDVITPSAIDVTYPGLLDLPAAQLSGYPVETTIAEKLDAIVDLGLANSRMKDYFDLWSLLSTHTFDGSLIVRAVGATFKRRGTEVPSEPSIGFTDAFAKDGAKLQQWSAFLRRLRRTTPTLGDAVHRCASFALPVFECIRSGKSPGAWEPSVGWT